MTRNRRSGDVGRYLALTFLILILACSPADQATMPSASAPAAPATAAPVDPPTHAELANTTFTGLFEDSVQLVDGQWDGEPFVEGGASRPTAGLVDDFILRGDLTGDGSAESVVLIWTNSGGSGTFDYLAAAGREGESVVILDTAELGDRVKVRSGRIVESRIEIDVVQAGPKDAACCPSQMATRVPFPWLLLEARSGC